MHQEMDVKLGQNMIENRNQATRQAIAELSQESKTRLYNVFESTSFFFCQLQGWETPVTSDASRATPRRHRQRCWRERENACGQGVPRVNSPTWPSKRKGVHRA